jgi:hypothetical protein
MNTKLAGAAALFFVAAAGQARDVDGFFWSAKLAPGQTIEIKAVQGSIHAEGSTGTQVEVVARKKGHLEEASNARIDVVASAQGFTVCAVNAAETRDVSQTGCIPGPGSPLNTDAQVDFIVRVPAGVRFVGRTVNGKIEARALHGDTEVHTVNGDVDLSTTGAAAVDTVNGSIVAALAQPDSPCVRTPRRPSVCAFAGAFHTVNGNITLSVPACASANVQGKTLYGNVSSDFPLSVRSESAGASVQGNLQHGKKELQLSTVNGSIRLRRKPGNTV